jgi:hypothetical protein
MIPRMSGLSTRLILLVRILIKGVRCECHLTSHDCYLIGTNTALLPPASKRCLR